MKIHCIKRSVFITKRLPNSGKISKHLIPNERSSEFRSSQSLSGQVDVWNIIISIISKWKEFVSRIRHKSWVIRDFYHVIVELIQFLLFGWTGIPCSYTTRCYSISITAPWIHTKRTYDTIRSLRSSILQRATWIKPEASKSKRYAATVQFHRSRYVVISSNSILIIFRRVFLKLIVIVFLSIELAIQPSLNASLKPRYSLDSGDGASAPGSSSAAPHSPSGKRTTFIHKNQHFLNLRRICFQFISALISNSVIINSWCIISSGSKCRQ